MRPRSHKPCSQRWAIIIRGSWEKESTARGARNHGQRFETPTFPRQDMNPSNLTRDIASPDGLQPLAMVLLDTNLFQLPRNDPDDDRAAILALGVVYRATGRGRGGR